MTLKYDISVIDAQRLPLSIRGDGAMIQVNGGVCTITGTVVLGGQVPAPSVAPKAKS